MKQCPQRRDYHPEGDVFTRTAYVYDAFKRHGKRSQLSLKHQTALFYAIVFHDMGKIDCTKRNPKTDTWASYGHAKIGTRYVNAFKEMIPDQVELIQWIVENHMKIKFKDQLNKSTLNQLKTGQGNIGWKLLNIFTECDDMLSYMDETSERERKQALLNFQEKCEELMVDAVQTYAPFSISEHVGDLVLVRGIPGSGKTTFASLIDPDVRISADDFFVNENGEYEFDSNKLPDAHAWCQTQVWNAMTNRQPVICVDNTFTQVWEIIYYYQAAATHGYRVHSTVVENRHSGKNQHGVPEKHVKRMKDRFQVYV